jgi:NAD(P)-binding Rossmann-like domain
VSNTPATGTERTTTVVIGTGLSGLAVASELSRHGVESIIVEGLDLLGAGANPHTVSLPRCDAAELASLQERNEILRHLRNYAASHQLDVRNTTKALQLNAVELQGGNDGGRPRQWAVHTGEGVLLAEHVVVTRCGQSQLRRIIAELGIAVGQNIVAAMRAVGIYLVGVGDLITPTPKEVLRQAKVVGQAISAKVNPDNVQAALTGSFTQVVTA